MIKILLGILLMLSLSVPTNAVELTAPEVPRAGRDYMPENTDSLGDALLELLQNCIDFLLPELEGAIKVCYGILAAALLVSLLPILIQKASGTISIAGTVMIASMMFRHTNTMILYAAETVQEICTYGKLLCPVMTTGLAAQGGITSAAALYAGTTAFITVMSMLITKLIIPMVYLFLIFSIAGSASENEVIKKFPETIKKFLIWLLKTLLIVFTTYMSVTGVISGTTDAAALKAAKVTVSSVVPVVGGILSDASESVLVSMGILKNAAGIYGILVILALLIGPFVKVGVQYILLKLTAVICGIWGNKRISTLVDDFSAAMGILLATAASGCILVLISTVCFMKGIG